MAAFSLSRRVVFFLAAVVVVASSTFSAAICHALLLICIDCGCDATPDSLRHSMGVENPGARPRALFPAVDWPGRVM